MSKMANKPICPHSFGQNVSHVNFGRIDPNYEADKWHFDSTEYVLVIIISDIEGMVGGSLEVLKMDLGSPEATEMMRNTGPPEELIESISYQESGYGIFAQGSKIMHRVSPVLAGKEDRVSLVISLGTNSAFDSDSTRTLRVYEDPENITSWEIARHYAWKAGGVLDYIVEESNPDDQHPEDFAEMLELASERLAKVAKIVRQTENDAISYLETKTADAATNTCSTDSCD